MTFLWFYSLKENNQVIVMLQRWLLFLFETCNFVIMIPGLQFLGVHNPCVFEGHLGGRQPCLFTMISKIKHCLFGSTLIPSHLHSHLFIVWLFLCICLYLCTYSKLHNLWPRNSPVWLFLFSFGSLPVFFVFLFFFFKCSATVLTLSILLSL